MRGLLAVCLVGLAGCTGLESYSLSDDELDAGPESDGGPPDVTGGFCDPDAGDASIRPLTHEEITYCSFHPLADFCPAAIYLRCRLDLNL